MDSIRAHNGYLTKISDDWLADTGLSKIKDDELCGIFANWLKLSEPIWT